MSTQVNTPQQTGASTPAQQQGQTQPQPQQGQTPVFKDWASI